jgi:Ca-activated chloride channel family protein
LDKGKTQRERTISYEEISAAPLRGSQNMSTEYKIDGVKVRNCAPPQPIISDKYFQPGEQYDKIYENEFHSALSDPLSTFSIDVDKASYSNVRRIIESGSLPPSNAVRTEEMINYFKYNNPSPTGNNILSMNSEVGSCPWDSTHYLLKIGLKAKDLNASEIPLSNFVFLLDVSGSMNQENKLPLVIKSMKMLVNQLKSDDRISIVVYAGRAGVVLNPVRGSEKEEILDALNRLSAGGSTAGGQGILLAYKLAKENFDPEKNNRVILCTDGDFNVGVLSDGDLIDLIEEERDKGIFLSVLGFGMGNYKDSKMEKLADKGNGNYFYIDNILEAEKVLVREMKGSLYTLAKDVKLQVEFNPKLISKYRLIGYENRLLNAKDFDDDRKDAGELGAGQEVTALYELIPTKLSNNNSTEGELRYHQLWPSVTDNFSEFGMIKFRYKDPLDSKSKLSTHIINSSVTASDKVSTDFNFAAAVASFSMLLRNSEFKAQATFASTLELAKKNKGTDEDGDRGEFLRLCRQTMIIADGISVRK